MEQVMIILANNNEYRMHISDEQYKLLSEIQGSSKCIRGFIFKNEEDFSDAMDYAIKHKLF